MKQLLAVALLMWGVAARADVRGATVTPDGMPVPNTRVELFAVKSAATEIDALMSAEEPLAAATSDAKGNFRVAVEKPGNYTISATAAGYAPSGTSTNGAEDIGGLLMRPAAEKVGRVTANGKPLPDAHLVFSAPAMRISVRTDAEGKYTVPDPAVWTPGVAAYHPGYAFYEQEAELGATTVRLDIAMNEGVTLRGRVLTPDGKSGAKARLSVDGIAAGESADDGTFELRHVDAKWKELLAVSGDLAARAGRTAFGSMRLQRAITATGKVLDAKTRVPLAGVLVSVASGASRLGSVTTDSKGVFSISAVLPGTYSLMVTHAGYAIARASENITPAYKPQTIYLNRYIRVSGTVTDEARRPASGANVRMDSRGRDFFFQTWETRVSAADGRYVLPIEPSRAEAADVDIVASKRGWATTRNGPHKLRSGDEKTVNIIMTAGVPITGRVTTVAGEPLGGVGVAARENHGRPGSMIGFFDQNWTDLPTTDKEGRFTIPVQAGTYDLVFIRAGYAAKAVAGVVATAESQPLDVKLEPGVAISGRVVTVHGDAVPAAKVHAAARGPQIITTTDTTGAFTLAALPSDVIDIYVTTSEGATEQRRIKAPAENVRIEMAPTIKVAGRITTKDGAAVPDFVIGVTPPQEGTTWYGTFERQQSFHDADGSFVLDRIPARPSDLVITAPGYSRARLPLKIETRKDLEGIEVKLERAGTISGRVTTETGVPIEGVRVMEEPRGNVVIYDWQPPMTNADGEYRFEDVPLGKTTITFGKTGFQNASRDVTIDGSESRVDVQMAAGKILSGRVVTEDGDAIADAEVRAFASSVNARYGVAATDGAGRFTFDSLGSGVYRVTSTRAGYVDAEVGDVNLDTTSEITLTMSAGATVTGQVTGIDPARYQDVVVLIGAAGKRVPEARVDAAGNFRVQAVPPGKIGIRAVQRRPTSRSSDLVEIETQNGGTYKIDLEFQEHNTVRGRVTVRGVPVRAGNISFVTITAPRGSAGGAIDENGQYEVAGVRSGEQNVFVADHGANSHYSLRRTITHSGTVDIDLNPGTLTGRAVSDTTDEPVPNALVVVEVAEAPSTTPFGRMETRSGADGRFVVPNVTPGRYAIRVTKEKFAPLITERVIRDGSTAELEARLVSSEGLTLRVIDSRNGRPVSAFVSARNQHGVVAFSNYVGARPDGALEVPLAPGTYRLNVFSEGLAAAYVNATSPGTKEVVLRPGGTLEIAASKPTLRGLIRASDGTTYNVSPGTPTDDFRIEDGTVITDMAAGSYMLEVTDTSGGGSKSVAFVIHEGQKTKVDV